MKKKSWPVPLRGASSTTFPKRREGLTKLAKAWHTQDLPEQDVVDIELAGFQVITTLLELMTEAVCHPEKAYSQLLINRVSQQYDIGAERLYDRIMAVLDYISGMTDVYALDLYRKINGMSLPFV